MECSSVRHSSLWLATLLMAIGCSDGFLFDDSTSVFTEVLAECPETADGTAILTVNTDAPDAFPYANCYEYVYDFDQVHLGSWTLEAVFNTDAPDTQCMFKKQEGSEIYYLHVHVPINQDISFGDEFAYLANCSYETEPTELLASSLTDSKKPVEQRMINHGILSDSDVKVTVVDYAGDEITEKLRVGRYIKLHAELMANTSDAESFQAVACDVFTPPDLYYNFITGGCGDGTIVDRKAGFVTTGREAYSPLFQVFRVARITPQLTFNCTFIICNDTCDGSSCELSRRRRGSDTVKELAGRYIQTSIVAKFDPEPEPEAIRIDVAEPSLTHERKHTATQRPLAVEIEFMDSETKRNLQVSLVLMVIVSVLCTLMAMLMTIYLLWVALSTAYQLSSAKGRSTLAVMKDATEI